MIAKIDQVLKRWFIQSPANGIFARDIAKSFVLDAAPQCEDENDLDSLADELQNHATSSQTVIVGPGFKRPKLPEPPTSFYQTFIGTRNAEAEEIRALHLRDRK